MTAEIKDRYYRRATLPFLNPSWDDASASQIKCETQKQVEHARDLTILRNDTSIDAPWWVHRYWSFSDIYCIAIMALFWTPLWFLWPFLFLFSLPPVGLNLLYITFRIPAGTDAIPRDSLDWKIHCVLQFILSWPVQVIAFAILVYSHIVMTIFGCLYLLVSSGVRRRSPTERFFQNLAVIAPHTGGPSLYLHFADCVAAVAGSVYRQGLLEFTISFANMFIINPWMKYWITGNIYLENLGERFITQIGQPLNDVNIHDVDTNIMKAISRAKNSEANRKEIDDKQFAPYYPYPPEGRRYAIGMQHAKNLTCNFVHTTHFRSPEVADEGPVASLSTSAELPVYRVMLWRNNPYHFCTGYVEANISNGSPSQPEKKLGLEHPMWLVNSRNKLAADRRIRTSLGRIDTFFDEFIPHLNHFVRLNTVGKEAADAALAADPRKGYESNKYQLMAEI